MMEWSAARREYYRELEPERRRQLLEKLLSSEPDDGADEYRARLFQTRYVDEKNKGQYVDRYLFQCVNFIQLYKSAAVFKRSTLKELKETIDQLLFNEAALYHEAGENALYWEIRNAAGRYFKSCDSPSYGRSLFGLLTSGSVNRTERMCRDAWEMTEGLTAKYGMQDQLRIWNRAVRDSLFACTPGAEAAWEAFSANGKKKKGS